MYNPNYEKGKRHSNGKHWFTSKGKIRSLDEDSEGYKYLGIIKVDDINRTEMKEIVGKEY